MREEQTGEEAWKGRRGHRPWGKIVRPLDARMVTRVEFGLRIEERQIKLMFAR